MTKLLWQGITTTVLAAMSRGASAQHCPCKPVRIVAGFAPGGSNDVVVRHVAPGITQWLKTRVVIENRPGAHASIGRKAKARAAPTGDTRARAGLSNLILNPLPDTRVAYNTPHDFAGLSGIGVTHQVIAMHPSVPAR